MKNLGLLAFMFAASVSSGVASADQGCYRVVYVSGGAQHDTVIKASSPLDARAQVKKDHPDVRTVIVSPAVCPAS